MSNGDNSAVKGIVAIVLIIVAAVILYLYFGNSSNPHVARDREVLGIDSVTGKAYVVTQKADERWPLTNPDTKQKTLWKAYYCPNEKIIFPIPPKTDTRGGCPHCGGPEKRAATIEDKDCEVKMFK